MARAGYLLLEDGRQFRGVFVGTADTAAGELVFNTSMTGYQGVLSDPSYHGQIVAMTYPLIGNYGVNAGDDESSGPQIAGLVVREMSRAYSSWRAEGSLPAYLDRHGIAALTGVDTRAVTRHVRSAGAMRSVIVAASTELDAALERARSLPLMQGCELASSVTTLASYELAPAGQPRFHVIALDFGIKRNSQRLLVERGCRVTTVPAGTPVESLVELQPDGFFLSNGPGDPAAMENAVQTVRQIVNLRLPVFGICLGHQLLAHAFGGSSFKLLYGHRGPNHPVRRLDDGAIEITAQNHGFAVAADSAGGVLGAPSLVVTHLNLNDETIEGLAHRELPVFGVQYHPEAAPGPHESQFLFDRFVQAMAREAKA